MPNKTRKQVQQEQQLRENIRRAKSNKKHIKSESKPIEKRLGITATFFERVFGVSAAPQTAQQSIPYRVMYKDGICRANAKLYNKTITFGDINYQLAQNDDKTQIFEVIVSFSITLIPRLVFNFRSSISMETYRTLKSQSTSRNNRMRIIPSVVNMLIC